MPELPEVETVRRGLVPALVGRRLAEVTAHRGDLRRPLPERFAERLTGRRVEAIGRRAKYLLLTLDDGMVLIAHLGMSGRFVIVAGRNAPPAKHEHVTIRTDKGVVVAFSDPRRFGLFELCPAAELSRHPFFADLGPEPLGMDFTGAVLAKALAGKRTPIKAALLDQRVVAGLGNIYVSEALFQAGLSPRRLARTVQGARAAKLAHCIQMVLEAAIAAGGSTLRDYARPSGDLGYFQHSFAVYDRAGKPCPVCAAGPIQRIVQAGRSTYFCSRCQR
jgi:formamidopyrimidine-DNA glycosylase